MIFWFFIICCAGVLASDSTCDRSIMHISFPKDGGTYAVPNLHLDVVVDKLALGKLHHFEMRVIGTELKFTRYVESFSETLPFDNSSVKLPFLYGINSAGNRSVENVGIEVLMFERTAEGFGLMVSDIVTFNLAPFKYNIDHRVIVNASTCDTPKRSVAILVSPVTDALIGSNVLMVTQGYQKLNSFHASSSSVLKTNILKEMLDPDLAVVLTSESGGFGNISFMLVSQDKVGSRYGRQLLQISTIAPQDPCQKVGGIHPIKIVSWRHGSRFMIPLLDSYVGKCVDQYGEWSHSELLFFKRLIDVSAGDESKVLLDIGSNIGTFAIPLSLYAGIDGLILAFEADRSIYNILCANIALRDNFESAARIQPFNVILGANNTVGKVTGETSFGVPQNFGSTSFANSETSATGSNRNIRSVDSVIQEEFGEIELLPRVSFVKIDVEGMELDVLKGMSRCIQKHRPVLYLEGDRADKHFAVISYLEDVHRYTVFLRIDLIFSPDNFNKNANNDFGETISMNYLAIPNDKLEHFKSVFGEELGHKLDRHHYLLTGKELLRLNKMSPATVEEYEFRAFSENGEDGVLQYALWFFGVSNAKFVDIGIVEDVRNSKFLETNFNWDGWMIHSSTELPIRDPDLVSIYSRDEGYWTTCTLLCGFRCNETHYLCNYTNEEKFLDLSRRKYVPRIIAFKPNNIMGASKPYISRDESSGVCGGANIRAFSKLASTAGYSTFYCERNGETCFMVKDAVINRQYFPLSQEANLKQMWKVETIYRPHRKFGFEGWTPFESNSDCENIY